MLTEVSAGFLSFVVGVSLPFLGLGTGLGVDLGRDCIM